MCSSKKTNNETVKPIIYQVLPRLFANDVENCVQNGTIEQNGCGKMNNITTDVLSKLRNSGYTHVWYTGVIEHANKTDYSKFGIAPDNKYIVKGNAGSPYAIKDYYDIDPDIAENVPDRMQEFEQLVERTHKCGLKVIIDFVPNHVAREYHSDAKPANVADLGDNDRTDWFFEINNNFYYLPNQQFAPQVELGDGDARYHEYPAKATGNDCFNAHPGINDWYETVKLNYGIDYSNNSRHFYPTPDTWIKMLNILLFWGGKGVDGFRCDMAHMVPVEFWHYAIAKVKEQYPHIIFIAEIYDVNLYRDYIFNAGFDYLYDKVNLYDTLRAIQCNGWGANAITGCWQKTEGIQKHMLNFLENHDEQRVASAQFLHSGEAAKPSAIVSATINCGPFMLYSGQEFGESAADAEGFSGADGRTTIFDYWSVPTLRRWYNHGAYDDALLSTKEISLRNFYSTLFTSVCPEPAISNGGFFDLMYVNNDNPHLDPNKIYTYLRYHNDDIIFIAVNFSNTTQKIKAVIPEHAFEVMGTKPGEYTFRDLLSGKSGKMSFTFATPVEAAIEPLSGIILKLNSAC